MKVKRICSILLCMVLTFSVFAVPISETASAAEIDTVASGETVQTTSNETTEEFIPPKREDEEGSPVRSGTCGTNARWEVYSSGNMYVYGSGAIQDYNSSMIVGIANSSIVETITIEEGITRIGNRCFYDFKRVRNCYLPNSIKSIGVSAFYGCTALYQISLPESITLIDSSAFRNTGLEEITIPSNIRTINYYSFAGCKFNSLIIPDSVTTIEEGAFSGCHVLKQIHIPDSVTTIGISAFANCYTLNNVVLPSRIRILNASTFENCRGLNNIQLNEGLVEIGERCFYSSECASMTKINIPSTVTKIGSNAFNTYKDNYYRALSSVHFLGSVPEADNTVFGDLSVTVYYSGSGWESIPSDWGGTNLNYKPYIEESSEITLKEHGTKGSGITYDLYTDGTLCVYGSGSIPNGAWSGKRDIVKVNIDNGITGIGEKAFNHCYSLEEINIPNSVTSIGRQALSGCSNLKEIILPESVTSIGYNAFGADYNMKYAYIPSSVTSIDADAFYLCYNLERIDFMANVGAIGYECFGFCESLKEFRVPEGVQNISERAFFSDTGIRSLILPETLTKLDKNSIAGLSRLEQLVIPKNVNTLDSCGIAGGCYSLHEIYCMGNKMTLPLTSYFYYTIYYPYDNSTWEGITDTDRIKYVPFDPELLDFDEEGEIVCKPTSGTLGDFDISKDSWSFANWSGSFAEYEESSSVFKEDYTYNPVCYDSVFGSEYRTLASVNARNYEGDEFKPFSSMMPDFGGNCFGMTVTAALFYSNKLDWSNYSMGRFSRVNDYYRELRLTDYDYGSLYATSGYRTPVSNLIETYQIWQLSDECVRIGLDLDNYFDEKKVEEDDYHTVYTEKHKSNGTYIKEVVDYIKQSDSPLIIGLQYLRRDEETKKSEGCGHAILAYGWEKEDWSKEDEDGWYKIYIYDPNSPYPSSEMSSYSSFNVATAYKTNPIYMEMNVKKNIWTYAPTYTDRIGFDKDGTITYHNYYEDDEVFNHRTYNIQYFDYFEVYDPLTAPINFNGTASSADFEKYKTRIMIPPDSYIKCIDSNGNVICEDINGHLFSVDPNIDYRRVESNLFETEITGGTYIIDIPYADFTIEYLSGADISILGQDNIINLRFTDQATIDVDMDENSVVIESAGDGNDADVQISSLREEGGFTSALSTGTLSEGSVVSMELTKDEVFKAEMTDSSGESSMDVYTHNETSNNTVFVETLTDDNDIDQQIVRPGELTLSQARLYGTNLTLDGSIGVNYFMELSDEVVNNDKTYIHFELPNGSTSDVPLSDAVVDTTTVEGKTLYVFKCKVAAKEMTDEITGQIIVPQDENSVPVTNSNESPDTPSQESDNSLRSRRYKYSVKRYADAVLENKDNRVDYTNAHDIVAAMLNYGAYAQDYFDHNMENPATDNRFNMSHIDGDYLAGYAHTESQGNDNVKFEGAKLQLVSETTLRMYFSIENVDPNDVTFTYKNESLEVREEGAYYSVSITGIAANELDEDCVITINDGEIEFDVIYSPFAYCYNAISRETSPTRTEELKDLMRALVIYNEEAKKYFSTV